MWVVTANIDKTLAEQIQKFSQEIQQQYKRNETVLQKAKENMVRQHQQARKLLNEKHQQRQQKETKKRQARYSKGFRGLWDRLRGKRSELQKQNEADSYMAHLRDRAEKDTLIQK